MAEVFPEQADARRVGGEFPGGQYLHLADAGSGQLCLRVEDSQALDLVVKQIHAHGIGATGREQIHQGAAHGELTVFCHFGNLHVAMPDQLPAHLAQINALPDRQLQAAANHIIGRRQTMGQAVAVGHEDEGLVLAEAIQYRQPFGDQLRVGRKWIVGKRFVVRQECHRQIWSEEADFMGQIFSFPG